MLEGDAKHVGVNSMEKRLHFKAASENIKLIVCHESSVIGSAKLPEEKCTSYVKRISEELPLTERSYVKDSKITVCIEKQPNEENAIENFTSMKLPRVVKNIQSDCHPSKVKKHLPKGKKENFGSSTSDFQVFLTCKTCKKIYKHKSTLNRHIKKSSHVQSNNLKIICSESKAELLQEFNISDTNGIAIAKKNSKDEIMSQDHPSLKFYQPESKGKPLSAKNFPPENKCPCNLDNCSDRCCSKASKSNANNKFSALNKKQCGNCLRNFKSSYSLKRHCLRFVCSSGSKRELDSTCLDSKCDSHKEERLRWKAEQQLISVGRRIMMIDHPLKSKSIHKCKLCSKSYESYSSLRRHVKKTHSNLLSKTFKDTLQNQDSNECNHGKEGDAIGHNTKFIITSPTVRNLPSKLYKNYKCENRCASSSFYEKHLMKDTRFSSTNPHNTEVLVTSPLIESLPSKPYKCYRCKKRYTSSIYFVKHLNKNSCSSVYECLFCQKKFKKEYIYEQHMKVEDSRVLNKSIFCVACKTIFCRTADLSLNMMQNSCSQCSFECSCGFFLIEHRKASECNAGMPGDALEERGHLSDNGSYNQNRSFHQNTCYHRNFNFLDNGTDSSGAFIREAKEVSCTLREAVTSMSHLGFTETETNRGNEITADMMRDVRNSCTSERGLLDDGLCESNGECSMNYTGTKGGSDIFQGGKNITGHIYGTNRSEADAMRFRDDIQASGVSDNVCIPQIPNMDESELSSQLNDYPCYNYSSQPQGPVAVPYSTNEISWDCSFQLNDYKANDYSSQLQFQAVVPQLINLGSFNYFSQFVNYREYSYKSQIQNQAAVPRLSNKDSHSSSQLINNQCHYYSSQPLGQTAEKP